jgi:hypothetical protein
MLEEEARRPCKEESRGESDTGISGSVVQDAQAVLRQTVGSLVFKADFHQVIRVVDGRVGIGDDAVAANVIIHVALPALVIGFAKDLHSLSSSKRHILTPLLGFKGSRVQGAKWKAVVFLLMVIMSRQPTTNKLN